MGKKKDCFGLEEFVCMTPNCPYAKDCIQVVWEKRLDRIIAKKNIADEKTTKRAPGRLSIKGRTRV
ncbi:MAG: hypothetical protein V3T86_16010 [Planctomycetota bacterium]